MRKTFKDNEKTEFIILLVLECFLSLQLCHSQLQLGVKMVLLLSCCFFNFYIIFERSVVYSLLHLLIFFTLILLIVLEGVAEPREETAAGAAVQYIIPTLVFGISWGLNCYEINSSSQFWKDRDSVFEVLIENFFKILQGFTDLKSLPNYIYELPEEQVETKSESVIGLRRSQKTTLQKETDILLPREFSQQVYKIFNPAHSLSLVDLEDLLQTSHFSSISDIDLRFPSLVSAETAEKLKNDFNEIAEDIRKRSNQNKLKIRVIWRDLSKLHDIKGFVLRIKNLCPDEEGIWANKYFDLVLSKNAEYEKRSLYMSLNFVKENMDRAETTSVVG